MQPDRTRATSRRWATAPSPARSWSQTASAPSQSAGTISASGSGNSIAVQYPAGDGAATASTVSAGGSNTCPVAAPTAPSSFPDEVQNDSQPCGSSKALLGGSLTANLTTQTGTDNTITTGLAAVATRL